MNILFISDVFFPRVNGVSTSINTFATELRALGHQVTLIAPSYSDEDKEEEWIVRVPSHKIYFDPEDRLMNFGKLKALLPWIRDKHFDVKYRIQEHPWLKMTFGKKRTQKLANWYEKKWSGIISNFWFGVFLGSTASIGLFLGLNLDIRHITFSSGNLALGLYGANYVVSNNMLFWGVFGF